MTELFASLRSWLVRNFSSPLDHPVWNGYAETQAQTYQDEIMRQNARLAEDKALLAGKLTQPFQATIGRDARQGMTDEEWDKLFEQIGKHLARYLEGRSK